MRFRFHELSKGAARHRQAIGPGAVARWDMAMDLAEKVAPHGDGKRIIGIILILARGPISREGAIAREVRTSDIFQPRKTKVLIKKIFNRKA